jgi:hypothetical protein
MKFNQLNFLTKIVKKVRAKSFLESFFKTRPPINELKSKGILKLRVFECDLGEHLCNTKEEGKMGFRIINQN